MTRLWVPWVGLTILSASVVTGSSQEFCISGACLGMREEAVVKRLGSEFGDPPENPVRHCYQLKSSHTFLTVAIDDEDPHRSVTSILATSEPNCSHSSEIQLKGPFAVCMGVRINQSRDEVLRTIGPLLKQGDSKYPWYDAPRGVDEVFFPCERNTDCSVMASVYFRDGRVVGVSFWYPDC